MNDVEGDPVRSFSAEETRQLTLQLQALVESVERGAYSEAPINTRLMQELHRSLFQGVRGHAGQTRTRYSGSEYLSFGPHRSVHRTAVATKLEELWRKIDAYLPQFAEYPTAPDFEEKAIHFAAWAHAELIRIHPFEDGNGRTSRLLMGILLVRTGLPNIPVEACKQEYLDALNHFFNTGALDCLCDLLLRVEL